MQDSGDVEGKDRGQTARLWVPAGGFSFPHVRSRGALPCLTSSSSEKSLLFGDRTCRPRHRSPLGRTYLRRPAGSALEKAGRGQRTPCSALRCDNTLLAWGGSRWGRGRDPADHTDSSLHNRQRPPWTKRGLRAGDGAPPGDHSLHLSGRTSLVGSLG